MIDWHLKSLSALLCYLMAHSKSAFIGEEDGMTENPS